MKESLMMKLAGWSKCIVVVILAAVMVTTAACSSNESAQPTPTAQANQMPSITSLVANPASLAPGDGTTVTCVASDPDGDALSYTWEYTGGTLQGTGSTITWIAPSIANNYTVKVTISDGKGGTANSNVAIVVAAGAATPTSTAIATPTSTSTPATSYGSIDIKSSPAGAAVIIDGVDTGSITPYVDAHIVSGDHTVKLEYTHYKWRSENVSVIEEQTKYINWALTYASDQTLTIQPDASDGKDSCVYEYMPDADRSTEVTVYAGGDSWAQPRYSRIYIQFSVSSIPSTAVIESAALGLKYSSSYSKNVQAPIGVYRVTSAWNESTVTWNNQPTFNTTVVDTVLVPTSATGSFLSWDVTSLVKSWSSSRYIRNVNCGVVLMDTDESTNEGWKEFQSSDATDATARPKLVITYYIPTP
jgi:hypothetical protein